MNRRWLRALLWLTVSAAGVPCSGSDLAASPPDAEFAVIVDGIPVQRVAISVRLEGESLLIAWERAFAELFQYHDRNGDGRLDESETSRLPTPYALRQMAWNPALPVATSLHGIALLDFNEDHAVSATELEQFYRSHGIGGLLVGAGQCDSAKRLTQALLRHVDDNGDGEVPQSEWLRLRNTLAGLDVNANELLTPDELVPRLRYPGASGTVLWRTDRPHAEQHPVIAHLPLLMLAKTSAVPLSHLPLITLVVNFSSAGPTLVIDKVTTASATIVPLLAQHQLRIDARVDVGQQPDLVYSVVKRLRDEFALADVDRDLELKFDEVQRKDATLLRGLIDAADRDGSGSVDGAEFDAWETLQERLAGLQLLVGIVDYQAGLFEALDLSQDGRLSQRELMSAAATLGSSDATQGEDFSIESLPRQIRITISRGQPRSPLPTTERRGPVWFVAMDRNADGDVSLSEFVGPRVRFRELDRDADGLLSPNEAEQAGVR